MRKALWTLLVFALSTLPAQATTITIDSTNCNADCYGLSWTLSVVAGDFGGGLYDYQALLQVNDDLNLTGTPSAVISAVEFKASSSVSDALLYSYPGSSSGWSTSYNSGLNAGGCSGSGSGFVCSQTATDPADFVGSTLTWGWYFNTTDPLFADLIGAHIGAKLTYLSDPGKLLSVYNVPEPQTIALMALGGLFVLVARRRFSLF